MTPDRPFLLRTGPDGTRQASWRFWVLVWVTPVLFAAATLFLVAQAMYQQQSMILAEGTVTHVYDWENTAPRIFYPGARIYSPRLRYTWTDGTETEATTGTSHTGWNFEIGSVHPIRYWPASKQDIVLVGDSEWWVARVIAMLTGLTAIPALIATFLARRWLRGRSIRQT